MSKVIGATVGTTISPEKIKQEIKPVNTVNGIAPDENGNVNININTTAGVTSVNGETGDVTITVPTKTSELFNDSEFLTDVPYEYVTDTELTAKGYAVKSNAETWTFTLEDGSTVTKKVVLA